MQADLICIMSGYVIIAKPFVGMVATRAKSLQTRSLFMIVVRRENAEMTTIKMRRLAVTNDHLPASVN